LVGIASFEFGWVEEFGGVCCDYVCLAVGLFMNFGVDLVVKVECEWDVEGDHCE